MFSRIVLPSPISLTAGQSLRLIYQLQITITPTTPQAATPTITGWPVAPAVSTTGTYALLNVGLSTVLVGSSNPSNGVSNFDSFSNEPSAHGAVGVGQYVMWVDNSRAGFTFGWPASGTARPNYVKADNVPFVITNTDFSGLTYSQTKESTWGVAAANADSFGYVRTIGHGYRSTFVGQESDPTINSGFYFEFNDDQSKTNVQTMTQRIKYSWSRTLTID
jgi:hypothetical protein